MQESTLPDLHFGSAEAKPLDWREYKDDQPDDDEPLAKTPTSVIAILGFDPLSFDHEEPSKGPVEDSPQSAGATEPESMVEPTSGEPEPKKSTAAPEQQPPQEATGKPEESADAEA